MDESLRWLKWAAELQALAQAGLWYSKDPYDIERFERIRDIAAEIMAHKTDVPVECPQHMQGVYTLYRSGRPL